ncbi:MAG: antitoxin family protein [Elainella sp. Prado103]|jgi:hypothetical protein|nr:antitoxin family protein [Elainella sp. Prado103]
MIQTLEAVFDGFTLQPEVPLNLKAGTKVRIIVETILPDAAEPIQPGFQVAQPQPEAADPPHLANIDHYLYGEFGLNEDLILLEFTT